MRLGKKLAEGVAEESERTSAPEQPSESTGPPSANARADVAPTVEHSGQPAAEDFTGPATER